jgi:cyclic pyranopterin phosphate synthase
MDSLNPDKYRQITRGGELTRVWAGIEAAQRVGLSPVKINVVAIAGFNDDEILDFARLTQKASLQVRFIEFMPIGAISDWRPDQCIPSQEIKQRLETHAPLLPLAHGSSTHEGPARLYRFPDSLGEIGFISPMSEHFCHSCNRLRLTAEGRLRNCLFALDETDVRPLLRGAPDDARLAELIRASVWSKWEGHEINTAKFVKPDRTMHAIGG